MLGIIGDEFCILIDDWLKLKFSEDRRHEERVEVSLVTALVMTLQMQIRTTGAITGRMAASMPVRYMCWLVFTAT